MSEMPWQLAAFILGVATVIATFAVFGQAREPTPVEKICSLLKERPWEWAYAKNDKSVTYLTHRTGVWLSYTTAGTLKVWLGLPNCNGREAEGWEEGYLYEAVKAHIATRIATPRRPLWDAAKQLAEKILENHPDGLDVQATKALADEVKAHLSEQ